MFQWSLVNTRWCKPYAMALYLKTKQNKTKQNKRFPTNGPTLLIFWPGRATHQFFKPHEASMAWWPSGWDANQISNILGSWVWIPDGISFPNCLLYTICQRNDYIYSSYWITLLLSCTRASFDFLLWSVWLGFMAFKWDLMALVLVDYDPIFPWRVYNKEPDDIYKR